MGLNFCWFPKNDWDRDRDLSFHPCLHLSYFKSSIISYFLNKWKSLFISLTFFMIIYIYIYSLLIIVIPILRYLFTYLYFYHYYLHLKRNIKLIRVMQSFLNIYCVDEKKVKFFNHIQSHVTTKKKFILISS